MLIICNGAIKSGSTWLYNILVNLVSCEYPPQHYLTGRSDKSPCIKPALLPEFLDSEDYQNNHYITKNHLGRPEHRALLQNNPHVYVFDIERDPRDVVVSNYYHDQFRNGFEGSFENYYWEHGRYVADQLSAYHRLWRDAGPRCYVSSYERLKTDFHTEAAAIARVLGLEPDNAALESLREATSLDSLRKDYAKDKRYQGEKFFRKGEVGDWERHFHGAALKDIHRVMDSGIPSYDLRAFVRRCRQSVERRLATSR